MTCATIEPQGHRRHGSRRRSCAGTGAAVRQPVRALGSCAARRRPARGRLVSRMWLTCSVRAIEHFLHSLRSQAAQPKKEANERRGKTVRATRVSCRLRAARKPPRRPHAPENGARQPLSACALFWAHVARPCIPPALLCPQWGTTSLSLWLDSARSAFKDICRKRLSMGIQLKIHNPGGGQDNEMHFF